MGRRVSRIGSNGSCPEIAIENLGCSAERARQALARYGYRGRGARVAETIMAAEDVHGARTALVAKPGCTAREFAKREGSWLVFVTGHVMAAVDGALLNVCGYGEAEVLVAARFNP